MSKTLTLEDLLIKEGKTRWLDIGNGGNFAEGFHYLDFFSNVEVDEDIRDRYFKYNILELTDFEYQKMGTFDLIRMQHVFEHFTPEEGEIVLSKCARLLNKGGYLLITVPDLKLFVSYYRKKKLKKLYTFHNWALDRIDEKAPESFYFSIFTHSLLHEQHKWCYDYEGLKYQIEKSGAFENIKLLKLNDKLASETFTHNRPKEDLCVIANKKY